MSILFTPNIYFISLFSASQTTTVEGSIWYSVVKLCNNVPVRHHVAVIGPYVLTIFFKGIMNVVPAACCATLAPNTAGSAVLHRTVDRAPAPHGLLSAPSSTVISLPNSKLRIFCMQSTSTLHATSAGGKIYTKITQIWLSLSWAN